LINSGVYRFLWSLIILADKSQKDPKRPINVHSLSTKLIGAFMNKVVFNDENIKKLGLIPGQSQVMYTDENQIRFKGKSATLMCRVTKNCKTLY
jgi:hypothetical protein